MPELPEVETIRRDLIERIVGKKIQKVEIKNNKVVKNTPAVFACQMTGNAVVDIDRVGKLLIVHLREGDERLLIHLKMTGRLIYRQGEDLVAGGHSLTSANEIENGKHTHVIWHFGSGVTLEFEDMRRFGYVKLVSKVEAERIRSTFGIEPLTPQFTLENFVAVFGKRTTSVKAVLLNQSLLAGIGNIYADEICFVAGVHPETPANQLSPKMLQRLYVASQEIIAEAIEHRGTTFYSYLDGQGQRGSYFERLRVYSRDGQPCLVCGSVLGKMRVAGRGTHFCPKCQKGRY